MKRTIIPIACTLLALACDADGFTDTGTPDLSAAAGAGERTYLVTLENLTTGQPLSPGVAVTHTRRARLFAAGADASEGIRAIAEGGDPSVAVADLTDAPGIAAIVATDAPIGRVGGEAFPTSLSFEITAHGYADRLSVAVMLICTNDGFAGLDGVPLPRHHGTATYDARAYDAGTEANDERYENIVDACWALGPVTVPDDGSNGRTATSHPIAFHRGIRGVGDLHPRLHGWDGPILRVSVQRIR